MPPTGTEVNHTSVTDHRILRRAEPPSQPPQRSTAAPEDLIPFHDSTAADADTERNRGLAIMGMLNRGLPPDLARQYAEKALPPLEQAFRRDNRDWPVVEARADALWLLGRRDEALPAYEASVAANPESESTLHGIANLSLALNRLDEARTYFERAAHVNPWRWEFPQGLATVSFRRGDWERSVRECQQAIALDPTNSAPRSLLVQCYLSLGKKDDAQKQFDTLLALTPEPRRFDLRLWYQEQQQRLLGPRGP
jgi:tetratricopeptide (TPR) repeat protein